MFKKGWYSGNLGWCVGRNPPLSPQTSLCVVYSFALVLSFLMYLFLVKLFQATMRRITSQNFAVQKVLSAGVLSVVFKAVIGGSLSNPFVINGKHSVSKVKTTDNIKQDILRAVDGIDRNAEFRSANGSLGRVTCFECFEYTPQIPVDRRSPAPIGRW